MSEAREKAALAKRAARELAGASRAARERALVCAARRIREDAETIVAANARDPRACARDGHEPAAPGPPHARCRPSLLHRRLARRHRPPAGPARMRRRRVHPRERAAHRAGERPSRRGGDDLRGAPQRDGRRLWLCLRSGNACVLKGGSAARESCLALVDSCRAALVEAGLPADALQYVDDDAQHTQTAELLSATGLVDVLIPRGGASLIRACVEGAKVPVIETGTGNCHIYVHEAADTSKARSILMNAKTQRIGVCNAAESLLVDRAIAREFLADALQDLAGAGVLVHADAETRAIAESLGPDVRGRSPPEDRGRHGGRLGQGVPRPGDQRPRRVRRRRGRRAHQPLRDRPLRGHRLGLLRGVRALPFRRRRGRRLRERLHALHGRRGSSVSVPRSASPRRSSTRAARWAPRR